MFFIPLILEKQTSLKIAEEPGEYMHILGLAQSGTVIVTYESWSWGTIAFTLNAL